MTVAKPAITYIGSPFFSSREGTAPEAIVVHVAAGSLFGVDNWFNHPQARVSAHFCVGKLGEIHQYVYVENGAWANGGIEAGATAALVAENGGMNPNRWTVSVEHEGNYPEEPTPAMFEASAQLSAWLFDAYLLKGGASGVAVDRKHIIRHAEISPKTRPNCPGWTEPMLQRYVARVKAIVEGPTRDERIRAELLEARRRIDAALLLLASAP